MSMLQACATKSPPTSSPCYICKNIEKDTLKFGEFMTDGDISAHYYCILLSTYNIQKGRDNEGFLGFLSDDIKNCERKIRQKVCCYCGRSSANIKCQSKRCCRNFHLSCGIKHGALFTYVDTFDSYCHDHIPYPVPRPRVNELCSICCEPVLADNTFDVDVIRAPCCKSGYFHRWCLAAFALSAGYFFKCPLCNNSSTFRKVLPTKGIFIPNQDASWEREPNAFEDLGYRPTRCISCLRHQESLKDQLLYCDTCGSQGIHKSCLQNPGGTFTCGECQGFIRELEKRAKNSPSKKSIESTTSREKQVQTTESLQAVERVVHTPSSRPDPPPLIGNCRSRHLREGPARKCKRLARERIQSMAPYLRPNFWNRYQSAYSNVRRSGSSVQGDMDVNVLYSGFSEIIEFLSRNPNYSLSQILCDENKILRK